MPEIPDSNGDDLIYRTIRVSGGTTLCSFQDKLIGPVMGWCRNYHGYVFTDRSDGALFGPEDSNYIDMMHLHLNGHGFVSDTKYTIADLLDKPGASLGYLYDLGDHWQHEITVEQILAPSESNGKFAILGGNGACPGEDMHGNHGWRDTLDRLRTNPRDSSLALSLRSARNYDHGTHCLSHGYDPLRFDITEARQRVQQALASPASERGNSNLITYTRQGGAFSPTPNIFGMGASMPSSSSRAAAQPLCEQCGTPHDLKRCNRCKRALYCSTECQTLRWKDHKRKCKASQ